MYTLYVWLASVIMAQQRIWFGFVLGVVIFQSSNTPVIATQPNPSCGSRQSRRIALSCQYSTLSLMWKWPLLPACSHQCCNISFPAFCLYWAACSTPPLPPSRSRTNKHKHFFTTISTTGSFPICNDVCWDLS